MTDNPTPGGQRPAYFTYDPHHGGAYYFAPESRMPPPYREQRHVEAIIDIGSDGTLAGVELVMGELPPPPNSTSGAPAGRMPQMVPSARERLRIEAAKPWDGDTVRDAVDIDSALRAIEAAFNDGLPAAVSRLRNPSEEDVTCWRGSR